jgi:hypothetical protein
MTVGIGDGVAHEFTSILPVRHDAIVMLIVDSDLYGDWQMSSS